MSFWRASLHHLFVCTCHVLCIYREKKLTKLFAFCNTTFHTFTGSCCVQYHEYTTTLTYHLRPGISSRLREEVFLKSSGLLVVLVLRDSELRRIWLNSCCLELAVHEWIKTFPILLLLYTKKTDSGVNWHNCCSLTVRTLHVSNGQPGGLLLCVLLKHTLTWKKDFGGLLDVNWQPADIF